MRKAEVVLVCGVAGAGKSTYSQRLAGEGYARLSFDEAAWDAGHREHPLPDNVAHEIHAGLRARLLELVAEGRDVVVDTSFWSRASRDAYRELLAPVGIVPVVHHVTAPRDVVLARLAQRRGQGPHDVLVPRDLAERYLAGFQPPTPAEGPLVVRATAGPLPPSAGDHHAGQNPTSAPGGDVRG